MAWKAGLVRSSVKGGHEVIGREVGREVAEEMDEEEFEESERVDVEKELVIDTVDDASTVVENYMKPSIPIDPDVKVIDFSRYAYRG